jgi:hypothetical protein
MKVLILFSVTVFFQHSFAKDLPDLPEAFDAGWKGEKTCQLLYETESARVGRCTFGSIFTDVRIYAFPNSGGWYDFGFFLGAASFFGGGGASAR